jgi:hypothetical protein
MYDFEKIFAFLSFSWRKTPLNYAINGS